MNSELRVALEALPGTRFGGWQVFSGPSPFSSERAVALTLSFDQDSASVSQAASILARALPDWHDISRVLEAGGDQHWLDAIAGWCRTILLDAGAATAGAGAFTADSTATLWVGYDDLRATQLVIAEALSILGVAAAEGEASAPAGLRQRACALIQTIKSLMPHSQTRIMAEAAKARSIPILPMFDRAMHQFGWGARGALFWETTSNSDGVVGYLLSRNKAATKQMIARLGFPTPPACILAASESPGVAAERLGWPLAVKPLDRGAGKGVTADIRTMARLEAAVARARSFSSGAVLVERHVTGTDHRLMVVDGSLVAAIERSPATIVGDGTRNVEMLVDDLNAARRRDLHSRLYLNQIALDEILLEQLAAEGLSLDSVPAAGDRIRLRSTANRSTGGDCRDVTASIHPGIAAAAVTICAALGLKCAGLDYLTPDISLRPDGANGSFIEVNTTPALSAIAAAGGDAVAVAGKILGDVGRIPSTLIVAPSQAWPALLDKLERAPRTPGFSWTCGGAARIGDRDIAVPHRTRQEQVAMLLADRQTHDVTIVCSGEELMAHGLPVDRVDLGILCEKLAPEWQAVVERHSARCLKGEAEQISWRGGTD